MRRTVAILAFCVVVTIAAPSQVFTNLANFDGVNGSYPTASLIQANDGNFYGTTPYGGAHGYGEVFEVTPEGELTSLYSFCSVPYCIDGGAPEGALIQASDGNFYGTTWGYGIHFDGTVFKITPGGMLTSLYSFSSNPNDGSAPTAGLVQANDGNFYGTTERGGQDGYGTIFRINSDGELTILHQFQSPDGYYPDAGLIQARDGNLYGTTSMGGASAGGTIFRITTSGTLTTLYNFNAYTGTDGAYPKAGLVQAADGNLYGTTSGGGPTNDGTVFKITLDGTLTVLYSFCSKSNCVDGSLPYSGLVQGSDGNFYGTTSAGGANQCFFGGCGTIFQMTPAGKLTTLHSFNGTDGYQPYAALVQAKDGKFYGTTYEGGAQGSGTVFQLDANLVSILSVSKAGSGTIASGDNHIYCGSVLLVLVC